MPSVIGPTKFMVVLMIEIQVVFGTCSRQVMIGLEVAEGTTIAEALEQSGIRAQFPAEDISQLKFGIWNKVKSSNVVVSEGDRVEIYRPLEVDPKEARRRRAQQDTY